MTVPRCKVSGCFLKAKTIRSRDKETKTTQTIVISDYCDEHNFLIQHLTIRGDKERVVKILSGEEK